MFLKFFFPKTGSVMKRKEVPESWCVMAERVKDWIWVDLNFGCVRCF